MSDDLISAEEFERRLAVLCLRGGGAGLPRKRRDRHILWKSMILILGRDQEHPQRAINEALRRWLGDVGVTIEIDHVSLRRHLVDEGYLIRDTAGHAYRVGAPTAGDIRFAASVDRVDPIQVIRDARREAERRKREYLSRARDGESE